MTPSRPMCPPAPWTYFHSTRCLPGARAYGGVNRSQQLLHVLQAAGGQPVPLNLFPNEHADRNGNLRAGLALALRRDFPGARTYSRIWTAGRYARLLGAARFANPGTPPLLLWENTADDLLAHAARSAGFQVVALPHDMVALNREGKGDRLPAFNEEIRALARTLATFTISEEENWLLRLFGCDSEWLPYHPSPLVEAPLLATRANRRPGPNAPVLILGSISNPQTRAGILHQLEMLRACPGIVGRQILLAGNDTDTLAPLIPPGVTLLGSASDDVLQDLLQTCAVIWIYQHTGTGALTRVVETLLAGLPVAGGGLALRSAHHHPDVHPADTPDDLARLLPFLPSCARQPRRPIAAETLFARKIRLLAGQEAADTLPPIPVS